MARPRRHRTRLRAPRLAAPWLDPFRGTNEPNLQRIEKHNRGPTAKFDPPAALFDLAWVGLAGGGLDSTTAAPSTTAGSGEPKTCFTPALGMWSDGCATDSASSSDKTSCSPAHITPATPRLSGVPAVKRLSGPPAAPARASRTRLICRPAAPRSGRTPARPCRGCPSC